MWLWAGLFIRIFPVYHLRRLPHADPQQTGQIFHDVTIDSESKLFQIIGAESIQTNSSHHQTIDRLGQGLKAVAFAPDGVIEAIEHTSHEFVIGVQWHPEGISIATIASSYSRPSSIMPAN